MSGSVGFGAVGLAIAPLGAGGVGVAPVLGVDSGLGAGGVLLALVGEGEVTRSSVRVPSARRAARLGAGRRAAIPGLSQPLIIHPSQRHQPFRYRQRS